MLLRHRETEFRDFCYSGATLQISIGKMPTFIEVSDITIDDIERCLITLSGGLTSESASDLPASLKIMFLVTVPQLQKTPVNTAARDAAEELGRTATAASGKKGNKLWLREKEAIN